MTFASMVGTIGPSQAKGSETSRSLHLSSRQGFGFFIRATQVLVDVGATMDILAKVRL